MFDHGDSNEREKARTLLVRATEFKDAGNYEQALVALREAYRWIANSKTDFGIKTFLRYPLYLQAAGRPKEAWAEFWGLVKNDYPNSLGLPGFREQTLSDIFDKMRLFLQREKLFENAVSYGVCAYLYGLLGEFIVGQKNSTTMGYFQKRRGQDFQIATIEKLLKKTAVTDRFSWLFGYVESVIEQFPDLCYDTIIRDIDQVMRVPQ